MRVTYIELFSEEFVVIRHATVHFFLQLVNSQRWVLSVCAGRPGQERHTLEFFSRQAAGQQRGKGRRKISETQAEKCNSLTITAFFDRSLL